MNDAPDYVRADALVLAAGSVAADAPDCANALVNANARVEVPE